MSRSHIIALWVALLMQLGVVLYLVWDQGAQRGLAQPGRDAVEQGRDEHGGAGELAALNERIEQLERAQREAPASVDAVEAVTRRRVASKTHPASTQDVDTRVRKLEARTSKLERQIRALNKGGNAFDPNDPGSRLVEGSPWSQGGRGQGKDTALTAAAASGDRDRVDAALRAGANINDKGKRGFSALTAALEAQHEDIALDLMRRGADVNSLDEGGETPLMWAAYRGLAKATKLLLDRGARVGVLSKTKNSALHDAVRSGNAEVVELLLKRGAKHSHIDGSGKSPLQLATERRHTRIVELLKRWGAR